MQGGSKHAAEQRTINDSKYCEHSPSPLSAQADATFAGDQSVGATLVPIPNTIVKPYSADGTPIERSRESRPSPAPLGPRSRADRPAKPQPSPAGASRFQARVPSRFP